MRSTTLPRLSLQKATGCQNYFHAKLAHPFYLKKCWLQSGVGNKMYMFNFREIQKAFPRVNKNDLLKVESVDHLDRTFKKLSTRRFNPIFSNVQPNATKYCRNHKQKLTYVDSSIKETFSKTQLINSFLSNHQFKTTFWDKHYKK